MEKTANTNFEINDNIKNRWSPRAFSDEVPSEEKLMKLFEAARWAASSYNEQPWRFILGVKGVGDTYDKLYEGLNEFNQAWAKSAPVLVFICAKESFSHNDKPNKHHMYDCGAAMSNLCIQATEEGLHVHQMAGILQDKAQLALNVPDGFKPITAAAIGFLGDPDQLPDEHKESELAERKRKPMEEILFLGSWEKPYN